MAVTKSWEQPLSLQFESPVPSERRRELRWLVASSLMVAFALAMVCIAKSQAFAELDSRLVRGELLNLNSVSQPEDLMPFLLIYPNPDERRLMAGRIQEYVESHRPLPNVGAVAQILASTVAIIVVLRR